MVEESGIASRLPARVGFSPTYYSHGMAANPPPARTRVRPGSLERPVNARLYRGTWLLVGIPLLVAAFSVRKAEPLPSPQPALPPSFDRAGALTLASDLAQLYPDRSPGTAGAVGAAQWFRTPLAAPGARAVSPLHTVVFVATDGGAFGAVGARRFAETHRAHVLDVIDLTTLASRGPPRLVL